MNATAMTLDQIRSRGLIALSRDLGPVGLVRFLQQYESGHGDYTEDRRDWLGNDAVQALAEEIERRRDGDG